MRATSRICEARTERGYTYLAVLVLLAVLATGAALTLDVAQTRAVRDAEHELLAIGGEFDRAFASYYRLTPSGQRPYPTQLDDLLRDPRFPGVRRHLRRLYEDPLNPGQPWGLIRAPGGGIQGVYSQAAGTPFRKDAGTRALPVLPMNVLTVPVGSSPDSGIRASSIPAMPAAVSPSALSASGAEPVEVTSYAQWRFGYDPQVDLAARQRIITPTDTTPAPETHPVVNPAR